jgi:hypothetical protein
MRFREYKAGDRTLNAQDINAALREISRQQSTFGAAGVSNLNLSEIRVQAPTEDEVFKIFILSDATIDANGQALYDWVEIIRTDQNVLEVPEDTRTGTVTDMPAIELNDDATIQALTTVVFAKYGDSQNCVEFETAAGSASSGFYASITGKTFTADKYIQYSWELVRDKNVVPPMAVLWTEEGFQDHGGPGNMPAFEMNNIDVPVFEENPTAGETGQGTDADSLNDVSPIVFMRKGNGNYLIFDYEPRWEELRLLSEVPTITIAGVDYYEAQLLRYDQTTKGYCIRKTVLARIGNTIPVAACVHG